MQISKIYGFLMASHFHWINPLTRSRQSLRLKLATSAAAHGAQQRAMVRLRPPSSMSNVAGMHSERLQLIVSYSHL